MPYGDGTGPNGAGPMTGRGMGPCGGNSGRGFQGRGRGMGPCGGGFGRGRGQGRGRGFRGMAAQIAAAGGSEQAQPDAPIEARLDILQRQLEAVSGQIEALRTTLRQQNLPVEQPKQDPETK